MAELIYSIGNIFSTSTDESALRQYNAKRYYIAPYQRGYKWASEQPNDAVCILMNDLFNAAENPDSEYYLQFITTKLTKIGNDNVLEVIDGQQRLTTLTILLSVLANKNGNTQLAISNNLLSYEIRPKVIDFFNGHIYQNIESLLSKSWNDFIVEYPQNNEQDIYYLFSAANKVNKMIGDYNFGEKIKSINEFEKYVLEKVKIILNNIERDISCEEIFSNLNDNKVELTSSELIKGLILTNSAREICNSERRISYKEIIEMRAVMGRQWDELAHWANRKDIKSFFFSTSFYVLDDLLLLLALQDEYDQSDSSNRNAIFNHFQSQIKKGNKIASQYFSELKEIKSILNEWFTDDNIYNSLGFVLFCRNSKANIKEYHPWFKQNKKFIRTELKKQIANILNFDFEELEYGKNNTDIHNLLLALSIFGDESRFDFTAFNNQKPTWSLEHIFPQNPEDLSDVLEQKDIDFLKSLCDKNLDNYEIVQNLLKEFDEIMTTKLVYDSLNDKLKKKTCQLSSEEKKILYRLIKTDKLHSIGNMALLTKPDNSSNKNGMFDKKRFNIAKRISNGSFVPKHTYDVFSKLISEKMTPDLTVWAERDIEEHEVWIKNKINDIKER
jgi:uncharacterized protein with ParB-like and HNH nuclease domain